MTGGTAELLDAEYRGFVRSLHGSTVAAYAAVSLWYPRNPYRRILVKLLNEQAPSVEDVQAAASPLEQWEGDIYPQVALLVNGHPDPDVRDAAQILLWRIGAMKFVVVPILREKEFPFDLDLARRVYEDGGALHRLRDAVREAPFRIRRPPSPSTQERYPDDRSLEDRPQTFFLWLDQIEQRERDYRPSVAIE